MRYVDCPQLSMSYVTHIDYQAGSNCSKPLSVHCTVECLLNWEIMCLLFHIWTHNAIEQWDSGHYIGSFQMDCFGVPEDLYAHKKKEL